jgi:hypothetical protein
LWVLLVLDDGEAQGGFFRFPLHLRA